MNVSIKDAEGGVQDDIIYPSAIPFVLVHLGCLGAIWTGVTLEALVLCITLYWLRIFAIGAGYHRYFSHRSYSTSRAFQFVLACMSQTTTQKSVIWWAAQHRHHHLHSDTRHDVHSPRHHGFIYSHVGWIFARRHVTPDLAKVADLTCFPELMWLHRNEQVPSLALALLCILIAGWSGFVVGFLWSTVLVYHGTFCINSLAHVSGSKRYVTGDDSRNNWLLAVFTMGEGWHNNHHAYQASVRQGFKWWETDPTYYLLRALSWTGLVWDLKTPPEPVLRNEQRLGAKVINRAAEELVARFNSERIADAIAAAANDPALTDQHDETLRPRRDELAAQATAIFGRTSSMDEIVDRAYELLTGVSILKPARNFTEHKTTGETVAERIQRESLLSRQRDIAACV